MSLQRLKSAVVFDHDDKPYRTVIVYDGIKAGEHSCSCPAGIHGKRCKHVTEAIAESKDYLDRAYGVLMNDQGVWVGREGPVQ